MFLNKQYTSFVLLLYILWNIEASAYIISRYAKNGFDFDGYEEYQFVLPGEYQNAYDFSDLPQVNEASVLTKYKNTSLRFFYESGLYNTLNLKLDLELESIDIESEQNIDYAHSNFNRSVRESYSRVTLKAMLVNFDQRNDGRYFAKVAGVTLPQIYAGEIYYDSYAILAGIGYAEILYDFEIYATPLFGLYPRHSKWYLDADFAISKSLDRSTKLSLKYRRVFNEIKVDTNDYYSNLEDYLYNGPINRGVGQMIHDRLFSDQSDRRFLDYQKLGIRLTRQLSDQSGIYLECNKLFYNDAKHQNFEISIGYSKWF